MSSSRVAVFGASVVWMSMVALVLSSCGQVDGVVWDVAVPAPGDGPVLVNGVTAT